MGDIIIKLLVQGHPPAYRSLRNLWLCQQTPNPEPSRIGMALLEVIDLDHQGQPGLPGRRVRRPAFVRESRQLFGLKAADPGGDSRTGDM